MNNKLLLRNIVLAIIAAVILLLIVLYLVYINERSINRSESAGVQSSQNNSTSTVVNQTSDNTSTNQSNSTNNTADQSNNNSSTTKTRDPNRFYNDRDGYSIIVPKGYIAKTADNVYEPGSVAADEHALMIDERIPESLKLGGSDWIPQVGIYTSENKSNRDISEYTKVTTNGYNFLKLVSIQPKDQFWFEGKVYTYLLQTDTKDYVITSRTKDAVEATVNSFELL